MTTADLFDQFFADWNGKSVEYSDPSNKFQCMDLAGKWCEKLGIPYEAIRNGSYGLAKDAWLLADALTRQYFDLIANSATNKPFNGDIVVFGTVVGPAGHISIDTGASTTMDVWSFDQNWDTAHYYQTDAQGNHIPYARTVRHQYYNGVLGWLHPKAIYTEHQALLDIKSTVSSTLDDSTARQKVKDILVRAGI